MHSNLTNPTTRHRQLCRCRRAAIWCAVQCSLPFNLTGCLPPCWTCESNCKKPCCPPVSSVAGPRPAGGECALPTARRFWAPTTEETDYWYSYDFGPIHFLMYSTEHEFHKGGCTSCSSCMQLAEAPEAVLQLDMKGDS